MSQTLQKFVHYGSSQSYWKVFLYSMVAGGVANSPIIAYMLYCGSLMSMLSVLLIIPASIFVILSTLWFGANILTKVREFSDEDQSMLQKESEAENRVQTQPGEAFPVWQLARIKLENYLNLSLRQVNMIFFLVLAVMIFGFGVIVAGVILAYSDAPNSLPVAALVSISGVVVEAIAATFLVVYKTTMAQAQSYISVLERINAVGMSLSVLEGLDAENRSGRDQALATLSEGLLNLYKPES